MNTFTLNTKLTTAAHKTMPYAAFINLEICNDTEGNLIFILPFQESNIGNVLFPALHGGLTGGFIESAAALFLQHSFEMTELPKMINFSLDYLRSGKPETAYARCTLTRNGSRIANIAIKTWQQDENKPFAAARAHFQMPR